MILGYINTKGRYASPSEQEQSVRSYADCYNLTIDKFLKTDDLAKTLPCNLKQGDVLIVADISIIGERFEDIIKVIALLSTYKLRICTIKENLTLDLGFPFLMEDCLNDVLKIYKGLLSIKNKAIQENLLQTGEKTRPPVWQNDSYVFIGSGASSGRAYFLRRNQSRDSKTFWHRQNYSLYLFKTLQRKEHPCLKFYFCFAVRLRSPLSLY